MSRMTWHRQFRRAWPCCLASRSPPMTVKGSVREPAVAISQREVTRNHVREGRLSAGAFGERSSCSARMWGLTRSTPGIVSCQRRGQRNRATPCQIRGRRTRAVLPCTRNRAVNTKHSMASPATVIVRLDIALDQSFNREQNPNEHPRPPYTTNRRNTTTDDQYYI